MGTHLHTGFLKEMYSKWTTLIKKSIHFLYSLTAPISQDEDAKRHEFILNILLLGTILLAFSSLVRVLFDVARFQIKYTGASPEILFIVFLFFLSLYTLSRQGYHVITSYIFLCTLLFSATYAMYTWGVDLPQALLVCALVIVMSGMLVGSRFSFITTIFISSLILVLGYLQSHGDMRPDFYWRKTISDGKDSIIITVTLFIIALVSWLSDREIHKSLTRAILSEVELKNERDTLEIKVEERTCALKEAQLQTTIELSRFAEFGRMTAGLFHDLLNPLTAVSLHLENLKKEERSSRPEISTSLLHISNGIDRIRVFSENALKQVQKQEIKMTFSVAHEIFATLKMLSYKARRANVIMEFAPPPLIQTYGNPLLFYRVIMNLVSNAIDSYADTPEGIPERKVKIFLSSQHDILSGIIFLTIQDFGCGIKKEHLNKVFDPLFTTKDTSHGTGLGLTICKDIIENQFRGSIRIESEENIGTLALVAFPIIHHEQLKHIYEKTNHYGDD